MDESIDEDQIKYLSFAELDRLEEDAARYRWLKENTETAVVNFWGECTKIVKINDECIDAAMKGENHASN